MLNRCAAVLAATLLLGGCVAETEEVPADETLPDSFPITGSVSDLPEGAPVPTVPDTVPQ